MKHTERGPSLRCSCPPGVSLSAGRAGSSMAAVESLRVYGLGLGLLKPTTLGTAPQDYLASVSEKVATHS